MVCRAGLSPLRADGRRTDSVSDVTPRFLPLPPPPPSLALSLFPHRTHTANTPCACDYFYYLCVCVRACCESETDGGESSSSDRAAGSGGFPIEDPPCMAAPAALADAIAPLILTYLSDDRDLGTARAVNTCWRTVVDLEGPRHSPFLRRLQLVQKTLPSVRGRMFTVEVIGSFQSGKSTLFRQLSRLMGRVDSIAALMPTKTHVWATMFDAISALIDGCDRLNLEIRDEAALMAFEAVSMQGDPDIDMTSGRFLWRLWKDRASAHAGTFGRQTRASCERWPPDGCQHTYTDEPMPRHV